MSTIFDTPVYLNQRGGLPTQAPLIDIDAELRKMRRGLATTAWYNPSKQYNKKIPSETVFVDGLNIAQNVADWSDPALDVAEARRLDAIAAKDPSATNIDRSIYGPWKNEYWYKQALNHYNVMHEGEEVSPGVYVVKKAAGGVIATTDSPAINTINVVDAIQGMSVTDYVLQQAINTETTPNLTMSIDAWAGFTVFQDIGEGDPTFQQKGAFTRKTFGLKKDVGHIAITDEATMVPDRNVWDYHVRHVATEMVKVKNLKIAIELLTATTTSGGADWGAMTTPGFSDNNPIAQLRAAIKAIIANGGRPSRIVSGSDPLADFGQNKFINGTTDPVPSVEYGTKVVTVPHLPGFTWYVDDLATQTGVIVFDPEAIKMLQGPMRTAMYRNEDRGIAGYITRDWNRVATIDDTIIRKLTSVSNG